MRQRVAFAGVVVAVVLVAVFGDVGYGLAGPPTAARLLLGWRFDLLFGTAAVVLAVGYLAGVRRVPGWSRGRTVAWLAGCVVVLVATSSGIGAVRAGRARRHRRRATRCWQSSLRCCWCSAGPSPWQYVRVHT